MARPESPTRIAVRELFAAGRTVSEIAAELGISKPTVCHHARKLGIPPDTRFHRRYDWDAVQRYYDEGHTAAECQARFGFAKASWNNAVRRGALVSRPAATPLDDYLVNGTKRSRHNIKRRLIDSGLRAARCEECGLAEWRGDPITLELHHRNGEPHDNRLENLQLLYTNCHARTENFGVRNRAA
jgi:AcrR family transcriptional regulator